MDFTKAYELLAVAEKALGFPKLKALHDAAVEELEKLVGDMEVKAEAPEPIPADEEVENIDRRV